MFFVVSVWMCACYSLLVRSPNAFDVADLFCSPTMCDLLLCFHTQITTNAIDELSVTEFSKCDCVRARERMSRVELRCSTSVSAIDLSEKR